MRRVWLLCGLLLLFFARLSFAENSTHTVQCGLFKTEAEAAPLVSKISAAGFSPVWIEPIENGFRVCAGRLANSTDAYLHQISLNNSGFTDTFMQKLRTPESRSLEPIAVTPDEPIVTPAKSRTLKSVSVSFVPEERSEAAKLNSAILSNDWKAIRSEANALADDLSDDDPLKGWALNRAAYAAVREDKATSSSLPAMLRVARGEVTASRRDRIEAQLMAADSWHYYFPNPLRGYKAYKEILRENADDIDVVVRCKVEIAACLLELAGREKATYEEARAACLDILNTVPAEFAKARAVADLMYCESFIFEGDNRRGLDELAGFEERHPGQTREIGMAKMQRGDAYVNLGLIDEAIEAYFSVMDLNFEKPEDFFYYAGEVWNLKFKAAYRIEKHAIWHRKDDIREAIVPIANEQTIITNELQQREDLRNPFPHSFYQMRRGEK